MASRYGLAIYALEESRNCYRGEGLLQATEQCEVPQGMQSPLASLSWLPQDNGLLLTSHHNGQLLLWESARLALVENIHVRQRINCHAMSSFSDQLNVAVGHETGISFVDLRAALPVQSLSQVGTSSLLWDNLDRYRLYQGDKKGMLRIWDIRRLDKQLGAISTKQHDDPLIQLEFVSPSSLMSLSSNGMVSLLNLKSLEVEWITDLDITCEREFRFAVIPETSGPLALFPFESQYIVSYNVRDGVEVRRNSYLSDWCADALLYNPKRAELYCMTLDQEVIHVMS